MKYIIIPILKILTVLGVIFLVIPCKWVFYLIFNFKWLSVRNSFTISGECILDFTMSDWIEGIFSKKATDNFFKE